MDSTSQRLVEVTGHVVECHGVQIRAQLRSVATVVQVTGLVSAANRNAVLEHLSRLSLLETPLILDLLQSHGFGADLVDGVIRAMRDTEVADLTLVVDPALGGSEALGGDVDVAESVAQALAGVAARIKERRAPLFFPNAAQLVCET